MAQDIRDMFKKIPETNKVRLRAGHEERFLERLEKEIPAKRKIPAVWFSVAASVLVLLGITGYYFLNDKKVEPVKTTVVAKKPIIEPESGISLGDLSPDLKKIENYYVANINFELSRLEVSEKNRTLVDSFMGQLSELNDEYKKLNSELNEMGPNDQTITAMIKNLQLRLQLMRRLKDKLNQLKTSKNETVTETSV